MRVAISITITLPEEYPDGFNSTIYGKREVLSMLEKGLKSGYEIDVADADLGFPYIISVRKSNG